MAGWGGAGWGCSNPRPARAERDLVRVNGTIASRLSGPAVSNNKTQSRIFFLWSAAPPFFLTFFFLVLAPLFPPPPLRFVPSETDVWLNTRGVATATVGISGSRFRSRTATGSAPDSVTNQTPEVAAEVAGNLAWFQTTLPKHLPR